MSDALQDANLVHKAEVERKLNIGKEKKAAGDECFKSGDIKGGKFQRCHAFARAYLHIYLH